MKSNPEGAAEYVRSPFLKAGALGAVAVLVTSLCYPYSAEPAPRSSSPEISLEAPPSAQPEASTIESTGEFSTQPTWSQEFSSMQTTALDTSVWRYDLNPEVPGYNDEGQAYTDSSENVRIEPGVGLVIEAHRKPHQYPNDPQQRSYEFTSGRIDTIKSFTFEYGKIEARMKLPKGEGVWPAFWLLSGNEIHTRTRTFSDEERQDRRYYLHNGEIDIMEYYGNRPHIIEGTVHTFERSRAQSIWVPDASETFHTYGVEITPDGATWTLDGDEYFHVDTPSNATEQWPFGHDNELFILLNLAIDGPAGPPDPQTDLWRLEVENLRYYSYTGTSDKQP